MGLSPLSLSRLSLFTEDLKLPTKLDDDDQPTEDKSATSKLDSNAAGVSGDSADQAANESKHFFAVDDELNRTEIVREEAEGTKKPLKQEGNGVQPLGPGGARIVEADDGGLLTGKSLTLSDLEGCGTDFLGTPVDGIMGFASTPCSGLGGGRVASQADYLMHCNSFEDFNGPCGPPGPGTEKLMRYSGVYGMPLSVFCLSLRYGTLSNRAAYNSAVQQGNLIAVFKYENRSRKLECFYISKAQAKSLYRQYKKIKEKPDSVLPMVEAKPDKDCKSDGGLVGAMDCVTKRIEGNGKPVENTSNFARSTDTNTGITTTSIRNPNGSRTVTRTDKNENVLSTETLGNAPASASSTDKTTGITTKSVRNPDGSRTVTRTDKNGNVLSTETLGNAPASASSTDKTTGITTKSVRNPDGSRTVTKTDNDGNLLSREKVR